MEGGTDFLWDSTSFRLASPTSVRAVFCLKAPGLNLGAQNRICGKQLGFALETRSISLLPTRAWGQTGRQK